MGLYGAWLVLSEKLVHELASVYASAAGGGVMDKDWMDEFTWLANHDRLADAWFLPCIAVSLRCKCMERGHVTGGAESVATSGA